MIVPLVKRRNILPGRWGSKPFLKRVLPAAAAALVVALCFLSWLNGRSRFDPALLADRPDLIVLDRIGGELRFFPDERGERHLRTGIEDVPDRLIRAFLAAEDSRFYKHHGYDLQSITRAFKDNLSSGRIVSGGSTITQQTVKMLYPAERTYPNKLIELARSVRLERALSKEAIMEEYLNRIPMGNNLRGVGIAARVYFGKECRDLNNAECALLASLPKAPGFLNPYGENREQLLKRRNWVLSRMRNLGYLEEEDYEESLETGMAIRK